MTDPATPLEELRRLAALRAAGLLDTAEGDKAIQEAAELLASTFRVSDVVARIGSDEFAVLLTGADMADGAISRLAEEADRRNRAPDARYAIEFSIGRARFDPASPTTLDHLLGEADRAMYEDKAARRRAAASPRDPGPSAP